MNQLRPQQQFSGRLQRLASMLYRHERSSTLTVLRNEIRRAVQARNEGVPTKKLKASPGIALSGGFVTASLIRHGRTRR